MTSPTRSLVLTPLEMVKMSRQSFLDAEQYLPLGAPTIFSGRGGEGKSTLALNYVAQVSTGTLPGSHYGQPRNVVLICHEDDPGRQVKPRLVAAGANMANVVIMSIREHDGDITADYVPSLNRDMALIRQAVEECHPALIVIDPLTSTIDGDLHKVQDVRRALNPLNQLAQERSLAIICIMHVRKGQGSASDKTSGSHAFRDVARSLLLFAHDEETGRRIVSIDKSSYSNVAGRSFAFDLVDTPVELDNGETTDVARVKLLGESDVSVSDVWAREYDQRNSEEQNDTRAWLRGYLMDVGGSAPSADVRKAAQSNGYVWRTVQRAAKNTCEINRSGYQGNTTWTLIENERASINDTVTSINDSADTPEVPVTYDATVSHMTEPTPPPVLCRVCSTALHPSQFTIGTHPNCDPNMQGSNRAQ
jgi:hypothetical protein